MTYYSAKLFGGRILCPLQPLMRTDNFIVFEAHVIFHANNMTILLTDWPQRPTVIFVP